MSKYKVIFWDIDGVVVLSEDLHREKINHVAANHSVSVSPSDWDDWHGIGDHRIYLALKERGLDISEDAFLQECLEYYISNKDDLVIRPGFKEAFNLAAEHSIFQATVTSGVKEQAAANLQAAGITVQTEFNLNASDIIAKGLKTKPAPDPYLEALRQLNNKYGINIRPEECLVIEDSSSGVLSAKRAGMDSVHWRQDIAGTISENATYTAHDKSGFVNIVKKLVA